ncbi:MAG: pentapeptide repeat-containing protein [Colwellia sp.]|nr:pentapeptide repeat-containing protein [Colwellia sp.]
MNIVQDIKELVSGEYHLKLQAKGKYIWNRWALTVIPNDIAPFIKHQFRDVKRFSHEELRTLYQNLGLIQNQELDVDVNLSNLKDLKVNFTDCIFPGSACFEDAEFSDFARFRDARFSCDASFTNSQFGNDAIFIGAQFSNDCNFKDVKFRKGALFSGAKFSSIGYFVGAKFSGNASFTDSQFSLDAFFTGVQFRGMAYFSHVKFNGTTLFNEATFTKPPVFHETHINQGTSFYGVIWPTKHNVPHSDRDAWRTLKHAMNKVLDHEEELRFFGFEMDAKINVLKEEIQADAKTKNHWLSTPGKLTSLFGLWCYKAVSNYGTSFWRPISYLAGTLIIFTFLYSLPGWGVAAVNSWKIGFQVSWANMLPFVTMTKTTISTLGFSKDNPIGLCLQIVTSLQSIISAVLFFLIGLAAKHKFSIK